MFTATLRCGMVLSYAAPTFPPEHGDPVPSGHHGYCAVQLTSGSVWGGAFAWRDRARSQGELLERLSGRSATTVHARQRYGLELRTVAAAEGEGLVDVDLRTGRIAARRDALAHARDLAELLDRGST